MINIEILRLEINELLSHIELFIGSSEKNKTKEALNDILIRYVFAENHDSRNDTDIIKAIIHDLSFAMYRNEFNLLINNICTLIHFIDGPL